ncbi:hypothetical protein PTRG_06295 [Pyrenophora tritici-repentis Pt-1C-BFP]|uniref:Uncharacterized protein n=1 Tax=Pyrenophora tritici-repentis (strain Pt-1C-BFP) TaxID=426418 RepID=B2W8I7_PYRTR|nr:uncharacterized protein PTRG_06295 [Pyrenophora tritici-repentis Pt-1C-BFP]EDU49215.1 hypothetical protein PTRG_06295 [Pyrenophora tritici-repentis Pt-1C-BFP]
MLFRSQVLFAFLASIAVVRGAERGGNVFVSMIRHAKLDPLRASTAQLDHIPGIMVQ